MSRATTQPLSLTGKTLSSYIPHTFLIYSSYFPHTFLIYSSCITHIFFIYSSYIPHVFLIYSSYIPYIFFTCFSCITHNRKSQYADIFIVRNDCSCWTQDKPCWQQKYTGMLCKHSVLSVLDRLKDVSSNEEREVIYKRVINFCNPNWYRKTYDTVEKVWYCDPPVVTPLQGAGASKEEKKFITRFREIVRFLPPEVVDRHLRRLECLLLEPATRTKSVRLSTPVATVHNEIQQYSNPPKRSRRKLHYTRVTDDENL